MIPGFNIKVINAVIIHINVNNTEKILIKIFVMNKKCIALKAIKNIDVGAKQYKK